MSHIVELERAKHALLFSALLGLAMTLEGLIYALTLGYVRVYISLALLKRQMFHCRTRRACG